MIWFLGRRTEDHMSSESGLTKETVEYAG